MKVYLAMEDVGEAMEAWAAFSSLERAKAEVERKIRLWDTKGRMAGELWKESDGAWWLGFYCVKEMVVDEEKPSSCLLCKGRPSIYRWQDSPAVPLCPQHLGSLSIADLDVVEDYFRAECEGERQRGDSYNGKPTLFGHPFWDVYRRLNP